jgi:hypothetical protein
MNKDEVFQSGEKELKKAFEEVTTRNVISILDYSRETRGLTRELQERVLYLEGLIREYEKRLVVLQSQITNLQQKLYKGGS